MTYFLIFPPEQPPHLTPKTPASHCGLHVHSVGVKVGNVDVVVVVVVIVVVVIPIVVIAVGVVDQTHRSIDQGKDEPNKSNG